MQQGARIQSSFKQQDTNLQKSFNNNRLIGDIDTNLRLFMQSAETGALLRIHSDAEQLARSLPEEIKPSLADFLAIVDVLEIRMKSLRENNIRMFAAERAIRAAARELLETVDSKYFLAINGITGQTCLMHHHFYVRSILVSQGEHLKQTMEEVALMFAEADRQLAAIAENLPPDQQKRMKKLRDAYYELDEGVGTIAAIRIITTETQNKIDTVLDTIKDAIARNSLSQHEASFSLVNKGLELAKTNIVLLIVSLACGTLLFFVTVFSLNQSVTRPLVKFVELLRKMTIMLTRLRRHHVEEDEQYQKLTATIGNRHDEIGQIGKAINDMFLRMRELALFRQTIEADITTDEIYGRLARTFVNRLGLDKFIIYEQMADSPGLQLAYCQPAEIREELAGFDLAERCRAHRTGAVVSSREDTAICNCFQFQESMDHICVPMLVGGHVIGVVQFLFAITSPEKQRELNDAISEARLYIAEALPILQSRRLARKLEELATKDQLTGLCNRRYLETSLQQIVAGIRRRDSMLGILMCDIDFFKKTNDTYGHDIGDDVLRALAQIFLKCVRESDMIIRFGGEEFLILLLDCKAGVAEETAEKIRSTVEKYEFPLHNGSIKKTLSIGVAEFTAQESENIWETIKFADVALYEAKNRGRNQVVKFKPEMRKESSHY